MNKIKLLMLPGLLNDASLFAGQVSGLAETATVTVADLTRSETIGELAADALTQAPDETFVLLGFSLGGYVAFEIMRRAPQRVRGLALLSTSARPDTPEATAGREQLVKQAAGDFPAVVETLRARMLHPEHAETPEAGGVFQSMALGLGSAVFARQQRAIVGRADSRPTLAQIACPTLALGGQDDVVTPPELLREIAAGIARAQLEIIGQCGHLAPLEQPEKVTEILRHWLATLPA